MPIDHDLKANYDRIMQQIIKGSTLVKVKAKRLYCMFSGWMYGKSYLPFDELPIQTQKAWVMTAYKIPPSVEDSDEECEV